MWFNDTKLNTTSIRLLKEVINGTTDSKMLMGVLGIKEWQHNENVGRLIQSNYIKKEGGKITLQDNVKSGLLVKISRKWDIERLFHDSNELVFSILTEPFTVNEIASNTGLSPSTIYRIISDLESVGVIKKEPDWSDIEKPRVPEKIQLDNSKEDLITFSKILKTEKEKLYEPDAEIIFKDSNKILKKVPIGKITDGATTAFTLFADYGIQYQSVYDYYIKQNEPLDIHDVLIHSIVAANHGNDKLGLTMTMVFYAKHKEKFDLLKLRSKAFGFNISTVWLDVEAYFRQHKPKNTNLFLPWEEFVSKAILYDIPTQNYSLPKPTPILFEEINKHLSRKMQIYLIGGENMRIKNLKAATKDSDIVVENKDDFHLLKNILITKLNYNSRLLTKLTREDKRIFPDDILEHKDRSNIDLFTKKILHDMELSTEMIAKADFQNYGNLKVGLLRNEHVFLLKAVACREGDIQDMALLVQGGTNQPKELQHSSFDWNEVWKEIISQERANPTRDVTTDTFQQISFLAEQTGIVAPFLDKLKRHVIDNLITSRLRGGRKQLNDIVDLLEGGDITEKMLRNRIDSLERESIIKKERLVNEVMIMLSPLQKFFGRDWEINSESFRTYLNWRLPLRGQSSDNEIRKFIDELQNFDYKNLGEVDDDIVKSLVILDIYEKDHFPKSRCYQVGASRICLRLANPKITNVKGYQVSELQKYRNMVMDTALEKEVISA